MCEHDLFDIPRSDAERAQLRANFLLMLDAKLHFPSVVGMQGPGAVEQMRPLTRIDDDDAFGVIDDPRKGGQPIGPVPVGEDRKPASQPASPSLDLRGLDANRAGLDRVEVHTPSTIDRTMSGRSK